MGIGLRFTQGVKQAGRPDAGGLVLGCIDDDFCKRVLILKHLILASCTRLAYFCTVPNSIVGTVFSHTICYDDILLANMLTS